MRISFIIAYESENELARCASPHTKSSLRLSKLSDTWITALYTYMGVYHVIGTLLKILRLTGLNNDPIYEITSNLSFNNLPYFVKISPWLKLIAFLV